MTKKKQESVQMDEHIAAVLATRDNTEVIDLVEGREPFELKEGETAKFQNLRVEASGVVIYPAGTPATACVAWTYELPWNNEVRVSERKFEMLESPRDFVWWKFTPEGRQDNAWPCGVPFTAADREEMENAS